MSIQKMILNQTSYFGPDARGVIASEFEGNRFKKALVVTDRSLIEAEVATKVFEELDGHYIAYEVFSEVKPNPTVSNVKAGVSRCQQVGADCIIAVGGGSVIDTAKAISIIMTNPEFSNVVSLDGVANTKNPGLPIIALPTTAGTAAEVTINYVITDEENVKKMVCVDPHDIPIVAIIDTSLMAKMPTNIAAWTGMDALTHAIEGYITKAAWSMTDMFHLEAIRLIKENIVKAVLNKDIDAINNMGIAQYTAGMGFSNVGLGIVHSMAHQLGAVYDTPHGLANAVLLPYVLKYNGEVCSEKIAKIGEVMGLDINALTKEETVNIVVEAIFDLNRQLNIPRKLKEIGVREEDLEMLSKKAFIDVCTPGNPKETSPSDILEIYKQAY